MKDLIPLLLLVSSFSAGPATASPMGSDDGWTWVLAASLEGDARADLARFASRMFSYYQKREGLRGTLVSETELESRPSGPTVFLGPAHGFAHPEWLEPLVEISEGSIQLGGRTFHEPEVGVFVASEDGQTMVWTGASGAGFRQIFRVPTGRHAATVTVLGRIAFQGRYHAGSLVLDPVEVFPRFLGAEELKERLAGFDDVAAAVELSPVHAEAGVDRFATSFQDRLREIVKGQRVLFVGETHWNEGVNRLFREILGWCVREVRVSTLFLEVPYSHSAHFQHYVTLASDTEAEAFWSESLRPLVISALTRELLDSVRVWNRTRAESPVVVACLDAEFDLRRTLDDALGVYFRALDPDFAVRLPEPVTAAAVLGEVERLRAILADQDADASPVTWMSPVFVANTLTNLEESARGQQSKDRMARRQLSIVRNVTEFHAERFTEAELDRGLVVFKEGGAHADRTAVRDDGAFWEAAYLDQRFEPTKGRVATMMVDAAGARLEPLAGVTKDTHRTWATLYHTIVDTYRWALRSGLAREGELYHLGGAVPPGVHQIAAARSRGESPQAWLVGDVDEAALRAAGLEVFDRPWTHFDAFVLVVGGAMEAPLPRLDAR